MNDDDNLCCRDIDIYTQAAMGERGITIPTAFVCEIRRYDGHSAQIYFTSHADLAIFLKEMNPERTLLFRGRDESRADFAWQMSQPPALALVH